MNINANSIFVRLAVIVLISAQTDVFSQQAESVPLQEKSFQHIQFGKIKENVFTFSEQTLRIDVDRSASFLLFPFDKVRTIRDIHFQWKSYGELLLKDVLQEEKRDGDDAVFKLGLLLKADDEFINPLVPSWLRRARAALNFPSASMIYLVADAKHPAGDQWISPYNKRITMISVGSSLDHAGWNIARHRFSNPVEVVGFWLMADGDNTQSKFMTEIKDIQFSN